MKRKVFAILLAIILTLGISLPVLAGESEDKDKDKFKDKELGDKVALETGHEATYIRKENGKQVWEVDIGDLVYIPGTDTRIISQWDYTGIEWVARANVFEAIVKKDKVTIRYEGQKLSWTPEVYVDGEKEDGGAYPWLLLYDPINFNYNNNTLRWNYKSGITRSLRIIEGMLIEYYTIDKMPKGDVVIKTNTIKDDGFVWTRPQEAWDANGNYIPLIIDNHDVTLDISELPDDVVFPITIDPDTTFYSSASDGYMYENTSAVWATTRDAPVADARIVAADTIRIHTTINYGAPAVYFIERGYVYFDTSDLGGVAVTDAVLWMNLKSKAPGLDYRNEDDLEVWIAQGMDTYPHDPLVNADFDRDFYTFGTDYGNVNATAQMAVGYNIINANNPNVLKNIIVTDGWTKLVLLERRDKENDVPPAWPNEWNWLKLYSFEKGAGFRPKLIVTFTIAAPEVTTDAATNVASTTARLNSTVDADGGELADIRFGYGTTTQATVALYDIQTDWVVDTYSTGEHPWVDIDTLNVDDEYFYRVAIRNDNSEVEGGELDFTTESGVTAPSNFKAFPSAESIGLTWTKGVGTTNTMIRWSEADYPADETEGTEAYFGTLSSYTLTGLTIGHTYYIVAIGEDAAVYTATVEVMGTTGASVDAGFVMGTPDVPETLHQATDYTQIENIPGYALVNEWATKMNIPLNTIWMVIMLGGVAFATYMVFRMSHSFVPVALTGLVGIGFTSAIGILPSWLAWVSGLLILGLITFAVKGGIKE